MPAKTIRDILFEEIRRARVPGGDYFDAHDEIRALFVMQSYPGEDSRFLSELNKRPNALELLDRFFALCQNSNRELLLSKARRWIQADTGRRRLLDIVDKWEKCLRQKESETEIT